MKNLLRNTFLLATLFSAQLARADVAINATNFPDKNFRDYLSGYDYDESGSLSDDELADITGLHLDDLDITSLKGIEYLTSLTELRCASSKLTSLDISKNTELIRFNVMGCSKLATIKWPADKSNFFLIYLENTAIKSFDLTGFTGLHWLNLSNTTSWGKTLDVSGLRELEGLGLLETSIETLIAHQTPNLYYNYNWQVKTVDFSNKGWEGGWYAIEGPTEWDEEKEQYVNAYCPLETLILSGSNELGYLEVRNFKNLKSVDVSGCEVLEQLNVYGNDALTSINLKENPSLRDFKAYKNAKLTTVNLTSTPSLTTVAIYDNAALKEVTWGDKTTIYSLDIHGNQLAAFDLSGFTGLHWLNLSNFTSWGKTLDVSGMRELEGLDLTGSSFETLVAHQTPNLGYNYDWQVKKVDFSNKGWEGGWYAIEGPTEWDEEKEQYVNAYCPLETLILSGSNELGYLEVRNFKNLKSVDVSGCEVLEKLNVYGNDALTSINLDGAKALYEVYVRHNPSLPLLDLKPVGTALNYLYCEDNALTWLDLSANTEMSYWHDADKVQTPKADLVTISADKVGMPVHEDFDPAKVKNLKAGGSAATPATTKISGQKFLIVSANAPQAASLAGKDVSYEYRTGWTYEEEEQTLKVAASVATVGKCFTKLSLSTKEINGTYGDEAPAAPKVTTSALYDGTISYTSSNEAVVKVADDGTLTIVGAGTAKVTVSGAETEWRQATNAATYTVTIAKASPKLQFASNALEMTILDKVPTNALTKGVYDGTVTFTSSNTDVATVDATGKVTVKAAGTVTITASAEATANCNQPASVSYTLKVNKKTAAIELAAASITGTWGQGITAPKATTTNDYDGQLSYTSSNKKVVTVSADGKLTVVGAGKATITVKATETALYSAPANATYKVVIQKATPDFHFAQEMVIADEGYAQNELSTGIYDGTDITYASSNEEIATVDAETGELTFLALGTVTITASAPATANCHAVSASYELEVTLAVGIASAKASSADGHFYTVDGIAVDKPVKGRVYVRNGKAVLYR